MKVLYYDTLEGHHAIKAGDLPAPEISEAEVLVRVKAFSLNHLDLWVMSGRYPGAIPLPHIFGSDASGIVEKVGSCVHHVRPGDEVIVFPGLSCGLCEQCLGGRDNECDHFSVLGVITSGVSAEFVKAPAANIFKKPESLTFEEAAGIGITYATAWNSLVMRGMIAQGDTVVVHAAGSGVGTALIQVARLFNATVITTVGDDWKADRAKALGADLVINYRKEDFSARVKQFTEGRLADIVVDHIGKETINRSISCLKRGGRLITFGATSGDEATISLRYLFGKNITIHGVYVGPKVAMDRALKLFPSKLRTVVDSVFSFHDAPKAYDKLVSRQFFGKIVVTV